MKYRDFLARVQEVGEYVHRSEAERAVESVLRLLGERLPGVESRHLASQFPAELKPLLRLAPAPAHAMGSEQFLDRLGALTGASRESAKWDACAVLTTLGEAITGGQLNHVLSELPCGYAVYFGKPELA